MPARRSRSATQGLVAIDSEIAQLTHERTSLLRRRPPRLTHAAEPTFGTSSMGSGERVIGTLAFKGSNLPRSVPHWDWGPVQDPKPQPRTQQPVFEAPNLLGTFHEDRLPTERNRWSIAQRSLDNPLKTLLLDDQKRNIPRHRTRTDLLASRKCINIPHMSFDVDMDGVVSDLDLKYAKAFDLDGDGILNKQERAQLRHAMAKDIFQDRKTKHNLGQNPISDTEHKTKSNILGASTTFADDFSRLNQKRLQNRIGGASNTIAVMQHHFMASANRDYGLGSDHNSISVKTHNVGHEDVNGNRDRCRCRSELLEQRRSDFRNTAKLAAFKPDGKELLFRRKADTSIQPTPV